MLAFIVIVIIFFFFFKQKTAYEMRISDWSSDVCSSDLADEQQLLPVPFAAAARRGAVGKDEAARYQPVDEDAHAIAERRGGHRRDSAAEQQQEQSGVGTERQAACEQIGEPARDRKSTRLNSSH